MMKRVSGIITTYHRDSTIVERAILSMKNQTYSLFEIIVVDDNEDFCDFSVSIRELCEKYNVRYIKQSGNKGACCARNIGIVNSRGDYLGFLDDDDEWFPDKIEKQITQFDDKAVGFVFCQGIIKNVETRQETDYYNTKNFLQNVSFDDLLCGDRIGSTSQALIKKECFVDVGVFWENQPARQDYEMWIRISQKYNVVGVHDKLFIHNIHDGEQISKSTKKSYLGYRNIYVRYKKYYRNNKVALYHINNFMYYTKYGFSFFNIVVSVRKFIFDLLLLLKVFKPKY